MLWLRTSHLSRNVSRRSFSFRLHRHITCRFQYRKCCCEWRSCRSSSREHIGNHQVFTFVIVICLKDYLIIPSQLPKTISMCHQTPIPESSLFGCRFGLNLCFIMNHVYEDFHACHFKPFLVTYYRLHSHIYFFIDFFFCLYLVSRNTFLLKPRFPESVQSDNLFLEPG